MSDNGAGPESSRSFGKLQRKPGYGNGVAIRHFALIAASIAPIVSSRAEGCQLATYWLRAAHYGPGNGNNRWPTKVNGKSRSKGIDQNLSHLRIRNGFGSDIRCCQSCSTYA